MRRPLQKPVPQQTAHAAIVERELLATLEPLGMQGRLAIAALVAVVATGVAAYIWQLQQGLRVTGMRDYVSWGLYMTNFVFFIGISHAGTLISAILRVTNAGWRRPITRMAEAITVFALMVGAPMVIIDMGRPDRVLNVFIHGRIQSPILWDVCSITTYLCGSILYLYVAMIPDMAILVRWATEKRKAPWLVAVYKALSLGYRGEPEQERRLNIALATMAVIIIPVAVSVHTVVSWVFGMTLRPGWHSTIFGPYFVVGAIYSGTAAIITAMAVFRKAYRLEKYLTPIHFRNLAKLLLVLTLLYTYFTLSEYLTTWYGGLAVETRLLEKLMGPTPYGASFWLWVLAGLMVPLVMLVMPSRRSISTIVAASVLINIGMWWKRYLIVVPTLETPYIPVEAAGAIASYVPTWVELSITGAALATFTLLYLLFSRFFPILSIWETAEEAVEGHETAPVASQPPSRGFRWTKAAQRSPVLIVAGIVALGGFASAALAQSPPVRLSIAKQVEGSEELLVVTASRNGRPLEGVRVAFFVQRTFGAMTLGEDVTLDDGTAAVPFPQQLSGDAAGRLKVIAEIVSPAAYAGVRVEAVVPGGVIRAPEADPFPRALWAPRAPLALPAVIALLLLIVWTLYAFAVVQLVNIKRPKEQRGYHVLWR